jgi:hypothetical protein
LDITTAEAEDPRTCGENSAETPLREPPLAAVPRKGRSRRIGQTKFCTPDACCKDEKCEKLNTLTAVPLTGSVCSISDEEFVQINMMVDSGATETVMTETDLEGVIDITEGVQCKRGQHYQCANGSKIPNLGERKFLGWTEEDGQKGITAQVCSVTQNLLSVSGMTKKGHKVVFDEAGSYIEDKSTGEKSWMHEVNGMYMLKLWVSKKTSKEAGF